jgi:Spy/CpxP family protein refolding chaperone
MIDYTKLNDRIIEQAYSNILTPEQKLKLIEGKFERAAQYYKSVQAPIYPNKD